MFRRAAVVWLLILVAATLLCLQLAPPSRLPAPLVAGETMAPSDAPRLLVLVVFDQFRGDYLTRWQELFSPDGFNTLTRDGAWFTNCHYPYANTVTGPGHATLGTGCTPSQHGIIGNDWYDRSVSGMVYCASLGDRYRAVPTVGKKPPAGGCPERLLVPTLGDVVKKATRSRGKVIGISLKDRGAVLATGRGADLCLWLDTASGNFITSEYYTGRLPSYMGRLNNRKLADRWFDLAWDRLRDDISYVQYSGVDDSRNEGTGIKQGRVFPHPMSGGEKKKGAKFYEAVYTSPFGNDLLWDAAKTVIQSEELGRRNTTDYLVVSFSSNDAVGHTWGPDSQEVLDVTLRSDLIVGEMIRHLDERVGRQHYVLALSADHGVCPLPELASRGSRVDTTDIGKKLEAHLSGKFGPVGKWIEAQSAGAVYLKRSTIKASGRPQAVVENAVAAWFRDQPHIQSVYTRTQLVSRDALDATGQQVKASFRSERSGDVFPIVKPYSLLGKGHTGTTHGSPHPYDTHVPLVIFGKGVVPGKRNELSSPQLAAVILAQAIGQKMPNSNVQMPANLFERR
jgi:predicted AlkP superfamily pyrophosphatase or phosphodiesterase